MAIQTINSTNRLNTSSTTTLACSKHRAAECLGDEIPNINRSMWNMLSTAADEHPDEEAVCSLWQPANHLDSSFKAIEPNQAFLSTALTDNIHDNGSPKTPLRWTYSQLKQKAESLATWLQQHGAMNGRNLVSCVWNSAEWALLLWTAAKLEMVFVPLDPRFLDTDISHYLTLLQPEVFVVFDETKYTASESLENIKLCISLSSISLNKTSNWHYLPQIMNEELTELSPYILPHNHHAVPGEEPAIVIFTSGTTSLPKGCLHTAANIWSETFDYDPVARKNGQQNRWLIHTPAWHIFALGQAIRGWRDGSSVVFAADKFDITASLRALQEEKITHVGAVPPLITALVTHPNFPGKSALSLLYVTMGGTLITKEDIQFCKENLGSEAVIQGFGMSEGSPIVSWRRDDPLLENGHHVGVGKVLPGARIRICAPNSTKPLNRGEIGELHIGGSSIINQYLNSASVYRDEVSLIARNTLEPSEVAISGDGFYVDETGKWFVTGDQAIIDDNDVLHINGRYKDIIIRGGENLVPAKIERCLQDLGVVAHVVGVTDRIAGELPVAVIQTNSKNTSKGEMMRAVVRNLGQIYTLHSIITLEDLQLKQLPMTATGKVRKIVLKEIANKLCESKIPHLDEPSPPESDTMTQLREIWAELLNVQTAEISITDPVSDIGDSVTALRFCKIVWERLGKKIYLPDLIYSKSIEQQAELLDQQITSKPESDNPGSGPSQIYADFESWKEVHSGRLINITQDLDRLMRATTKVASGFGLSLYDVDDIFPIRDIFQNAVKGQRPQTFRHRIAFEVDNRSPAEVRMALEKTISARPILRTLGVQVQGEAAVHIVLRPIQAVFQTLITELPILSHPEIDALINDESNESFERDRMLKVVIASMGNNKTALIISLNHSIFDALSVYAWYTDLDTLISNPSAEPSLGTSFKLFADIYEQYKGGSLSIPDINFHVKQLRGISRLAKAFWPQQRAPGWMIGNDIGSEHFEVRDQMRKMLNPNHSQQRPDLIRVRDLPNLELLRSKHSIHPSTIFRTAISLFNIQMTKQSYAIFSNYDAGRAWPFLAEWVKIFPPAMSIDGPTLTTTTNVIEVIPKETCGELLRRLSDYQEKLSKHAHAPWSKIAAALYEEGAVAQSAAVRQVFNWDVSVKASYLKSNDYQNLNPIARMDWPDCGFFWNCGMLNTERIFCKVLWDEAQVASGAVGSYVDSMFDILEWIVKPENWSSPISMLPGFPEMT